MNKGDSVVLKESVIVTGSFGSELLINGTKGIFIGEQNGLAEICIRDDTHFIPVASINLAMDIAA